MRPLRLCSTLLLVIALAAFAQDAYWRDFLGWLQKQPPAKPAEIFDRYRAELISRRLPADAVRSRMAAISEAIYTRQDGIGLFWDKIFAARDPIFLQTPTALLMSAIRDRQPGRALDIGMGQGRNSVYLALQKWEVTGFDPSEVAVRMAKSNAERAGVKIRALIARDDNFDYGDAQWDLIVMTYVRDLNDRDAELFWRALKPGGLVVYENGASAGNLVLKAFLRYRIVRFEDVLDRPDWNPGEKTRVQRLIAQKP